MVNINIDQKGGNMFGLSQNAYEQIIDVVKNNSKYKFKLFGSRARGDYKNNSDIDLAIFENVGKQDEFKIRNEMDLLDIVYMVDLVFVNQDTKQELLNSIEKEGVELS